MSILPAGEDRARYRRARPLVPDFAVNRTAEPMDARNIRMPAASKPQENTFC